MANVKNVVIKVSGDTTELKSAQSELRELGQIDKENAKQFNKTQREFQSGQRKASDSIKTTKREMQRTGNATDDLSRKFRNLGGIIATAFAVNQIAQFTRSVVDARAQVEMTTVAFKQMLGSQEKANKVLKDLEKFGAKTPFNIEEVERSAQALLTAGLSADDLMGTLTALGNAAAGTNTNFQELTEVYSIFKVQNKIMSQDIRQLTARGIPILDILAEKFGTTADGVFELASAGQISFPDIEQAFMDMSDTGGIFFNLMDEQSKTLGGQISNLEDSFIMFKRELGERLAPVISDLVQRMRRFVENLDPDKVLMFAKVMGVLAGIFVTGRLVKGIMDVTKTFKSLIGVLNGAQMGIVGVVGAIISVGTALINWTSSTDDAIDKQKELADTVEDTSMAIQDQARILNNLAGASTQQLRELLTEVETQLDKLSPESVAESMKDLQKVKNIKISAPEITFDEEGNQIIGQSTFDITGSIASPTDEAVKKRLAERRQELQDRIARIEAEISRRTPRKTTKKKGKSEFQSLFDDLILGDSIFTDETKMADLVGNVEKQLTQLMNDQKRHNRDLLNDKDELRRADMQAELKYYEGLRDLYFDDTEKRNELDLKISDIKFQMREMDLQHTLDIEDKKRQAMQETFDRERALLERRAQILTQITDSLARVFVAGEDEKKEAVESFVKDSIRLILTELKARLIAAEFEVLAGALVRGAFDPTALARATGRIAILTAAFSTAQAGIDAIKFHDGTDFVKADPQPGLKSYETPAILKHGEAVIRDDMNAKYPGLAKAWNTGRVEQWMASQPKLMQKTLKDARHDILRESIVQNVMSKLGFDDKNMVDALGKNIKSERQNTEYLAKVIRNTMKPNYRTS